MRRQNWWLPFTLLLAFGLAAAEPGLEDASAQRPSAAFSVPDGEEAADSLAVTVAAARGAGRVLDLSKRPDGEQRAAAYPLNEVAPGAPSHALHAGRVASASVPPPLRC
jgi:hypothetical protein